MPSGQRARFSGRGRERAWWLLAAAVLFAVLWAVAQVLAWPLWARGTLAGLAAATALVVPELRARYKQDDARATLVTKTVAVPSERKCRFPLVREAGLTQLRVHAAQVRVPYVERDVQQSVADALGPGRAVLLVGHSMAGKTRLAAQVVRQRFPAAPLLVPESGKALRELVGEGLAPAGVVVWLDDLERFLGPDGLTMGMLTQLTSDNALVVATLRSQARETYRPRNELRLPEWEVLEAFTRIDLKRRHTATELDRIRAAVTDPDVLAAVQQYGLAEYLGAGPLSVDKFESGETVQPVGHALVRAAVDWRRTGLTHPIPKLVLATPAIAAIYLADRPQVPRSQEALDKGLEWATNEINETVALLGRRFTDPVGATAEAFEAFDYLVDHVTAAAPAIPEPLWQLSLNEAQPTEWNELGYSAWSDNLPVAELAFRKAAETGDRNGMTSLGLLLLTRGDLDGAETWWRRAAEAGQSLAMTNLATLLHQRGELAEAETELAEAETWYRRAAEAGDSKAMTGLGMLYERRDDLDEAETWFRRAAEAGDSKAMTGLGALLHERGELAEGETWYRRAAEADDSKAMTGLGMRYERRDDLDEAETWFRRAAEAGDSKAMTGLGMLYERRDDLDEAETWFRRAAEADDSKAMTGLGALLHELGEAETWHRRAAEAGDSIAMTGLGALLHERDDLDGAETWFRQAAEAGQSLAMARLAALLYERGDLDDLDEAETWLQGAAEAGQTTPPSSSSG